DPLVFAQDLLARGIELLVRNNRLHVWPAKAHRYLTAEERAFLKTHRAALKELATAKVLPEATVVWTPPGEQRDTLPVSMSAPSAPPSITTPSVPRPWYLEDITEHEIIDALSTRGDQAVAAFRAGTLSRAAAEDMVGWRRRQLDEMDSARGRPRPFG